MLKFLSGAVFSSGMFGIFFQELTIAIMYIFNGTHFLQKLPTVDFYNLVGKEVTNLFWNLHKVRNVRVK